MNSISGKKAIVTGGGSGVGRAIAEALVLEGADVVIASRRKDLLNQTAEELNPLGKGRVYPVVCDVRNSAEVKSAVASALKQLGRVDILVNNSGLGVQSKIADCSEEDWDLVLETNLKGAFLMTKEVLPAMIRQKSGFIINIASQAAKHGYSKAGPYCASKFGLLGLGEALQEEVREHGIRVHSLCPALIQVPKPVNEAEIQEGVLQVGDIASAIMFLLKQPDRVKFENIGLYHL
ncbi:MAG: SDR family oxidoreductase [Verrucomicrobia bacterium]|nr:MAG: SDR family oxidoreductase [Verrucomicrobiota bacterium]